MHRRLVEVGQRGVTVRRLGGSRAGEMRLTRFLRNEKVSPEEMFAQAAAQTAQRVAGEHVLAIQDTTSLRDDGDQRSLMAHATIAVSADSGALLGLVNGEILRREGGLKGQRASRAFEDKQSHRWLAGAQAAAGLAEAGARQVTVIADREGDVYETFALKPEAVELVVRSMQDRNLADGGRLYDEDAQFRCGGRLEVSVGAAPGRRARKAWIDVRYRPVRLKRPDGRPASAGLPEEVTLYLVETRELDPPKKETPLHWRLLTTYPVESATQAHTIIDLYRQRWVIEELFRTLKTRGFDIERVSIADQPFETLSAAALIAAVSVLQLVRDRDGKGKRPLEDVFAPGERAALEAISVSLEGKTAKQKNPHPKGSLAFAAWVCGRLGGWTGYYAKPGPIVMLRGLYEFRAMQRGWDVARNV